MMDTISEFITRIRNASLAKHDKVDVPSSKMRVSIAQILTDSGYIRSYKVAKDSKQGIMRVYLKYNEDGTNAISDLSRVSTPGRRVYVKKDKIPVVRNGNGLSILSTSRGVMSSTEALKNNLGGELLCTIW